jgi:cytidylate kinase
VRLVAPREARLDRLRSREGLDARAAAERLEKLDSDRSEFIRRHFRCRPDDPGQYDLVLDTASFGLDHTVDLVIRALELKGLA